jgi:hypothetical protein
LALGRWPFALTYGVEALRIAGFRYLGKLASYKMQLTAKANGNDERRFHG